MYSRVICMEQQVTTSRVTNLQVVEVSQGRPVSLPDPQASPSKQGLNYFLVLPTTGFTKRPEKKIMMAITRTPDFNSKYYVRVAAPQEYSCWF